MESSPEAKASRNALKGILTVAPRPKASLLPDRTSTLTFAVPAWQWEAPAQDVGMATAVLDNPAAALGPENSCAIGSCDALILFPHYTPLATMYACKHVCAEGRAQHCHLPLGARLHPLHGADKWWKNTPRSS